VVGGTWTVTSASTAHWTIKSGSLEVASGGELTSTTVSSGGVLVIESGGTASSSFVKAGGTEIIESGAIVSGAIISNGGTVELVGGIALPPGVQLSAGAILGLAGGAFSGLTVSSGHTVKPIFYSSRASTWHKLLILFGVG
jgi:autotransporter passenger strand-loop-strand repeat protein